MVEQTGQLGVIACLSFVIGNIIGSGIFITPGTVLTYTGSIGVDLIVWAVCGGITILGGFVFIELGTSIPSDGGDFAYTMYAGWNSIAFAFMFIASFISYPGAGAIQANIFGQYMTVGLIPFWDMGKWTQLIEWSLGSVLLITCTILNMFPVGKGASIFQMAAVNAKAIILMTVIAVGMWHLLVLNERQHVEDPFKGSILKPSALALACYQALWSFAGWDILNAGIPSVKNPKRTLPFALLGGLMFVTVTYLLTNLSFCVVLDVEKMKTSRAVAADFAQKTMGSFAHAVPFATALMLLSTVNGSIFALSRIMSKAAEEGHLPKFLAARHRRFDTPVAALLTQLILTLFMSVFSIETIINYASVIMWGQKTFSVLALLKVKQAKMEVGPDVLRMPLILTFTFFLLSLALTIFPAWTEPKMFIIGISFVAVLAVSYHVLNRFPKPEWMSKADELLSRIVCRFLNSEIPEKQRSATTEPLQEEEEPLQP